MLVSDFVGAQEALQQPSMDQVPANGVTKIEPEIDSWPEYDNSLIDKEAYTKSVASDVTGGVLIEEIIEPAEGYSYAVFNKKDPFVPPYLRQFTTSMGDDEAVPIISILQTVDLSSLEVSGIWQSIKGNPKALLMTRNQQGVIVTIGDPVGKNNGKVVAITDSGLTVREFTKNTDGTQQFEDITLELSQTLPSTLTMGKVAGVDVDAGLQRTTEFAEGKNSKKAAIQKPGSDTEASMAKAVEQIQQDEKQAQEAEKQAQLQSYMEKILATPPPVPAGNLPVPVNDSGGM